MRQVGTGSRWWTGRRKAASWALVLVPMLAFCAGNALAAEVLSATMRGGLSVGGGTYDTGPGPSFGIQLRSDDPNPQLGAAGSYVTPLTPSGYDFAAPGNAHAVEAGIPGWGGATAKLMADIAPQGSGINGLAINHLQLDLWVADNPDGLGKASSASFNVTSSLTKAKDPTTVYGALHWELVALPNPGYGPNATLSMDLRLWDPVVAYSGPMSDTGGNATIVYDHWWNGGSDYFNADFVSNVTAINGACGQCARGGGRFLVDVWWAFSDTPIDPAMLSPAPEPQSWMMMLCGLAVAGVAQRRRILERAGRR